MVAFKGGGLDLLTTVQYIRDNSAQWDTFSRPLLNFRNTSYYPSKSGGLQKFDSSRIIVA